MAVNNEQADKEIAKGNKQLDLIDDYMDQLSVDIENHTIICNKMVPMLDTHFGTFLWQ